MWTYLEGQRREPSGGEAQNYAPDTRILPHGINIARFQLRLQNKPELSRKATRQMCQSILLRTARL